MVPPPNAIEWRHIDLRKYYTIGPSVFIGLRALLYPPQLVKTRLQVQTQRHVYLGAWDAFKNIVRLEGVRGLYKGFLPYTFGLVAGQVYITAYEVIRNSLRDHGTFIRGFVAGGVASLIGQSIAVPIDVISQKMMMEGQRSSRLPTPVGDESKQRKPRRKPIRNVSIMMKHIYRKHGLLGFYRGYWASILTFAPNSAVWWSTYSMTTDWVLSRKPENVPMQLIQAACGCFSGLMACVLSNPMDVVRTRLQVLGGQSIVMAFRRLYAEDGWTMVYKGLTARLLVVLPSSCVIVVAYEVVKRLSLRSDIQLSELYSA